jgi:DtxR family transcriptional regulator, Mn-dependent transcriptional regulator
VDGKTAAEDACQMEHAVSPKSYEALRRWTNRKKASGCE